MQDSNNPPLLHTIEQTRELLACGRNSVYNLVSNNELTMIKMGRRSLITEARNRAGNPNGIHDEQVTQ